MGPSGQRASRLSGLQQEGGMKGNDVSPPCWDTGRIHPPPSFQLPQEQSEQGKGSCAQILIFTAVPGAQWLFAHGTPTAWCSG